MPLGQISRMGRSRTQSQTYATSAPSTPQPQQIQSPVYQEPVPAVISPPPPPPPIQIVLPPPVAQLPPPPTPIAIPTIASPIIASPFLQQLPTPNPIAIEKRRAAKSHTTSKKNKKSRGNQQVSTKDLGRWKPIDDLALIIGIQQTNDLRTVHRGVKFSCKFTVQELQNRWYSLLYDEPISRIAVVSMRNLHPEMVEAVQSKALYTTQEEELLGTVKSVRFIHKFIVIVLIISDFIKRIIHYFICRLRARHWTYFKNCSIKMLYYSIHLGRPKRYKTIGI